MNIPLVAGSALQLNHKFIFQSYLEHHIGAAGLFATILRGESPSCEDQKEDALGLSHNERVQIHPKSINVILLLVC